MDSALCPTSPQADLTGHKINMRLNISFLENQLEIG